MKLMKTLVGPLFHAPVLLCLSIFLMSGCARLYHVHVGNIDNRVKGRKFEIKISEVGINLSRSGDTLSRVSKDENFKKASDIVSLFQIGPKTGNPIYNVEEFKDVHRVLKRECPSMKITKLMSVREMRNYDVASGEIVKITGVCAGG